MDDPSLLTPIPKDNRVKYVNNGGAKRGASESTTTSDKIKGLALSIISQTEAIVNEVLDKTFTPEEYAEDIAKKSNKSNVNEIDRFRAQKDKAMVQVNNAREALLKVVNDQTGPLIKALTEYHKCNKLLFVSEQGQQEHERMKEERKNMRIRATNAISITKTQQKALEDIADCESQIKALENELATKDFYKVDGDMSKHEKQLRTNNRKTVQQNIDKLKLKIKLLQEQNALLEQDKSNQVKAFDFIDIEAKEDANENDDASSEGRLSGFVTPKSGIATPKNLKAPPRGAVRSFLALPAVGAIAEVDKHLDILMNENKYQNADVLTLFDGVRDAVNFSYSLADHDKKMQNIPVDTIKLEQAYDAIESAFPYLSVDHRVAARWRVEIAIVRGEKLYDGRRGPIQDAIKKVYEGYIASLPTQANPMEVASNNASTSQVDVFKELTLGMLEISNNK